MISQAGWWTQTPSATLLQTIKWNAHILIMFNFWWLARLVNGLELHPPPLCSQKNEMLLFWITLNFWWLAGLSDGIKPHPPPVSSQKKEILVFVLHWTFDDQPGWLMDSNPICRLSPANKKKCSFLDYDQLLMISQAGQSETPSATPLQPRKWNAHFWITFNFWWLAGLVDGLEPHPPPLFSQKSEMLIFVLHSTSDVGQTGQWTWTSFTTPLQPKIWNAHFWVTFNFWWLVRLFDELKPHLPALSSQ